MSVNETRYCICIGPKNAVNDAMSRPRAAVLKDARWQTGDRITVRFLDGEESLRARVRAVAKEWEKVANLSLQFVDSGSADVRIAFVQGNGSWSYLGTVCRTIPESEPTMNFGWLTPASDEAELRRVVLHEFGHAIGLIHEHQNPQRGIAWNKPAVIADLSGPPNNWDEATIENNMFKFYGKDAVIASDTDPRSIMMYPIPKSWTLDGFSAGLNGELSPEDKHLVGQVYVR